MSVKSSLNLTVTSIYCHLGSPHNVAEGLFVEAYVCTLWDFSFVVNNHRPWIPWKLQKAKWRKKITLINLCNFYGRAARSRALPSIGRVQSKAHACCAVQANLLQEDSASGERCTSYESFWFCTLQRRKRLLYSGHVIVQQLQQHSPSERAGKSYTKMWWAKVRKTQEEDKKEILGHKMVWDITLMKAVLEGMQNYWVVQLVSNGKKVLWGGSWKLSNLYALLTRKATSAGYTHLSEGKIVSLFLEDWASTNTTVVNDSRQDSINGAMLHTVLLSNNIYT